MYCVYIGCEEWQDSDEFNTLKEAEVYINEWELNSFNMGLYRATYAWVENESSGYYREIEI